MRLIALPNSPRGDDDSEKADWLLKWKPKSKPEKRDWFEVVEAERGDCEVVGRAVDEGLLKAVLSLRREWRGCSWFLEVGDRMVWCVWDSGEVVVVCGVFSVPGGIGDALQS